MLLQLTLKQDTVRKNMYLLFRSFPYHHYDLFDRVFLLNKLFNYAVCIGQQCQVSFEFKIVSRKRYVDIQVQFSRRSRSLTAPTNRSSKETFGIKTLAAARFTCQINYHTWEVCGLFTEIGNGRSEIRARLLAEV